MKKRLLLSLMAVCMSVAGFALTVGEYVYTPQGRFQIVESNVNTGSSFATFDGWTAVSANGLSLEELFVMQNDGYAAGIHSVKSQVATAGEGMYFKFEPSDPSFSYVVSFKMKGAAVQSIRCKTDALSTNLVKVSGNTDGTFTGTTDLVTVNRGEELSEEWQTFNYAIVGDGKARAYYISFTGMATTIEIADLQIAQAQEFADLRLRDRMIDKLNAYKNCYEWDQDAAEILDAGLLVLDAITDESTKDDLTEALAADTLILLDSESGFRKLYMDDFLAGDSKNYLGKGTGRSDKLSTYGIWSLYPGGRGYATAGNYLDLGHYQQGSSWNFNAPTGYMGVSTQKVLDPGSYVFEIEGLAAVRENAKSSWTLDDGMKPAYGVAYVVKIVDGADPDTIASVVKDLNAVEYTPFLVPAKLNAKATYELGLKVYCKEAYQTLKCGSVVYVANASFWGKTNNEYSQAQLSYVADVLEQVTTGRNNLTTAAENLAKDEILWGKDDLQQAINTYEPLVATYEAYDTATIVATFDEAMYDHNNRVKTAEEGLLVFEVYDTAVKGIIAANRTFNLVNDTLKMIGTAISKAEAVLKERIYDSATGKADLQSAIDVAKGVQTTMMATDYSKENAATIVKADSILAVAVEEFKTTIPASEITELVNLDFSKGAKENEETLLYEAEGTNTVMTFSFFKTESPSGDSKEIPFELGIDSNGDKILPDVLRVGNGTGTATIPEADYGTNILKVSMDWWFVRLSGKYTGFDLLDDADARVAGLYFSPYDGTFGSGYDDFKLDECDGSVNNSIANFFVGNTTGDAGSCADDNKTHMEVILDFGEKSMYLVATTPNGTFTSTKQAFSAVAPVKFVVKSNYANYYARRSWFDNLKLEKYTAGEATPFIPTGVKELQNAEMKVVMPSKVLKNGRLIINGKYGLNGILIK